MRKILILTLILAFLASCGGGNDSYQSKYDTCTANTNAPVYGNNSMSNLQTGIPIGGSVTMYDVEDGVAAVNQGYVYTKDFDCP